MTLAEKVSRMYSCRDDCDTCPCAVDRVGLPPYAYLLEANTAVAAVCLGPNKCATVFSGPNGLAGSFNRSVWEQKGKVLSYEVRGFANHGGKRGLGKLTGIATYGPNINSVRDPRFGRNSELPGEDPFLSGTCAVEMIKAMQEEDAGGHPRAIAYLKHYTAYSRETNRGHDSYTISPYDFTDTYLPQYEMGMVQGNASGVMCR
jgi:beta-glucosidase-like glycosyl hydrolase